MRMTLIALMALIALCAPVVAQRNMPQIPPGAIVLGVTSGNVAAATATATLPAPSDGTLLYICGFSIQSLGATAASTVTMTITGLASTFSFSYLSVAGATTRNDYVIMDFPACMPASGPNTAIVVSLPSLGAGNTNANVNAWGIRY